MSSTWKQVVPHAFPRFSQSSANIVSIYLFSFLSNNTAATLPQLKHHIPIAHLNCRYVLYRLAETVFLLNGLPARLSMRITAQILHANDFKAWKQEMMPLSSSIPCLLYAFNFPALLFLFAPVALPRNSLQQFNTWVMKKAL